MQETDFIIQNKDKWHEFEEVLQGTNKDPERITDLFIETTDDLSYSRTYYPNRSVRVYLNGISQQVYQTIYKNKKKDTNVIRKFWLEELPEAMWHNRKALLLSFLLFAAGITIGIVSSMYYPEFARIILGDSYIEMTEANIANGDPMAVYKDSEPLIMFFQIAWNNIKIAYGTFVLGILFGLGTIYVVFYNAVMVGAFIYFFIERGLFKESFLAIMLHGTLELSMIVIAGCAGLALARGLVFPGTYTRGQALIHSARNGIKILISVTVLLIYAAIIESFATRYTEMPDFIRATVIILSFSLVLGYFVLYPRYRFKLGLISKIPAEESTATKTVFFDLHLIKSSGKIFTETFDLFSRNAKFLTIISFFGALLITIAYGLITKGNYHEIREYDIFSFTRSLGFIYPWSAFNEYLNFVHFPIIFGVIVILFAIYSLLIFTKTNSDLKIKTGLKWFTDGLNAIFIIAFAASPLLLPHVWTFITMPFVFPTCLFWLYVTFVEKKIFLATFLPALRLMKGNYWKLIATFMATFAIQWLCMFIFSSEVIDFILNFVTTNIPRNAPMAEESFTILYTFFLFFIPAFILSLSLFGTALLFYSLKEVNEANTLLHSIEKIGFRKRAYGLEQEA